MENILITGANRGIGLELTKQFLGAGHHVIATCRDPAASLELRDLASVGSVEIHSLEVTDGESVDELSRALAEDAGCSGQQRRGYGRGSSICLDGSAGELSLRPEKTLLL